MLVYSGKDDPQIGPITVADMERWKAVLDARHIPSYCVLSTIKPVTCTNCHGSGCDRCRRTGYEPADPFSRSLNAVEDKP